MKKSILSLLLACFLQINLAFAQNVMKGVVSDANGVYARLRNRTFHSLLELNRAVWELMESQRSFPLRLAHTVRYQLYSLQIGIYPESR